MAFDFILVGHVFMWVLRDKFKAKKKEHAVPEVVYGVHFKSRCKVFFSVSNFAKTFCLSFA